MMEAQGLVKRYGDKVVVDKASIQLSKGSLTALVGPNGAGKSTLLGMLGRLIPAESGNVTLEGKLLSDYKALELAKELAVLKQANHIQAKLSLRQLVAFGRYPHSEGRLKAADWAAVDKAIEQMSLAPYSDRRLDTLSGGQRQRAFLAMVIAQETPYLLLDEPLNHLDLKRAHELMLQVRWLAKSMGKTVLIVLHDINMAATYVDDIIAMKAGRIQFHEPVAKVMVAQKLEALYDMPLKIADIDGQPYVISNMR